MGADLFISQHTSQLLHNGNNYQIFVAKNQRNHRGERKPRVIACT
jgi:hypothetical protein